MSPTGARWSGFFVDQSQVHDKRLPLARNAVGEQFVLSQFSASGDFPTRNETPRRALSRCLILHNQISGGRPNSPWPQGPGGVNT